MVVPDVHEPTSVIGDTLWLPSAIQRSSAPPVVSQQPPPLPSSLQLTQKFRTPVPASTKYVYVTVSLSMPFRSLIHLSDEERNASMPNASAFFAFSRFAVSRASLFWLFVNRDRHGGKNSDNGYNDQKLDKSEAGLAYFLQPHLPSSLHSESSVERLYNQDSTKHGDCQAFIPRL